MENASKALIIAGAILLSILIIGMGMFIFSRAQDQIFGAAANMSESEIETFNTKFENYAGKISGSQVKKLINVGIQNRVSTNDDPTRQPDWVIESATLTKPTVSNLNTEIKKIVDRARYDVSVEKSDTTGIINKIIIKKSTSTSGS